MAYVGIDNQAAGQTAAYLVGSSLPKKSATVFVTVLSIGFSCEEERQLAFSPALHQYSPHLSSVIVSEGFGRNIETQSLVQAAIKRHPNVSGVYSVGGGNQAVLDPFQNVDRHCHVFIAHDLDTDIRTLLHQGKINAVFHHDLCAPMRRCFLHVMQANGALAHSIASENSVIQVITPINIPNI